MSNNKITPLTLYVYHNIESQKWGFVLTLQYVYETSIPLVMQLNCAHPILQINFSMRCFAHDIDIKMFLNTLGKYGYLMRPIETHYYNSFWQNNSCVISEAFEYNNVFKE